MESAFNYSLGDEQGFCGSPWPNCNFPEVLGREGLDAGGHPHTHTPLSALDCPERVLRALKLTAIPETFFSLRSLSCHMPDTREQGQPPQDNSDDTNSIAVVYMVLTCVRHCVKCFSIFTHLSLTTTL